jgi:hypothetical protein
MDDWNMNHSNGKILFLHNTQTGSGAQPAYYPMDTASVVPRGKVAYALN